MTAKQKAARERFKKVVAEASKLRKKNPKLTQAQAVKQAWAISYGTSKKVGSSLTKYKIKRNTVGAKYTKNVEEMMSLVKNRELNATKDLINYITDDLLEKGFEYEDVREMFDFILSEMLGEKQRY